MRKVALFLRDGEILKERTQKKAPMKELEGK